MNLFEEIFGNMNPAQEAKYNSLSKNQQIKFLSELIDKHPNHQNLQAGKRYYINALIRDGIDSDDNDFINYINNVTFNADPDTVQLVYNLINNDNISIDTLKNKNSWLYKKDLYSEGTDATNYKIKALVYASNKDLQRNANRTISQQSLMTKAGKLMSADEMKKVLNRIRVNKEDQLTIQNGIDRQYGYLNLNNQNNAIRLKNKFKKLIKDSPKYSSDMDGLIDNADISQLTRIPISNATENGIRVGLINFLLGKSTLVNDGRKRKQVDVQSLAKKLNKSEEETEEAITTAKNNRDAVALMAIQVLTSLGVPKKEASDGIDKVYKQGMTFEDTLNAYWKS